MPTEIRGGTISVEDSLPPSAQFASPRKVKVDLTFTYDGELENADRGINQIGNIASRNVKAILLGKADAPIGPTSAKPETPARADPSDQPGVQLEVLPLSAEEENTQFEERVKRKRRTKAEMEAARAVEVVTRADPAALPEEPELGKPELASEPEEAWEISGEVTITDQALHEALAHRMSLTSDRAGITKLIASYNPAPGERFSAAMIPQDARAGFLERLQTEVVKQ